MRGNDEEAISHEETNTDSVTVQNVSDSDSENNEFTEVNENERHVVDMDTLLDNYDPAMATCNELHSSQEIIFGPGEGQVPISVFTDENAEYLSFPTFFVNKRGQIIRNNL